MKCRFKNDCPHKYLCCAFCDNKTCWRRCKGKDCGEKCEYFIDEEYKEEPEEDEKES